jgi:hypothetical protein
MKTRLKRQPWAVLACPSCQHDAVISTRVTVMHGKVNALVYCANTRCDHGYGGRFLQFLPYGPKLIRRAGDSCYEFEEVDPKKEP